MALTFRPNRSIAILFLIVAAIFVLGAVSGAGMSLPDEPARHGDQDGKSAKKLGAILMLACGAVSLLCFYPFVAFYLTRFEIDGTSLSIRSIFRNREFDLSEVERLTWNVRPRGGAILFYAKGKTSRLNLGIFERADRFRIIDILFDLVPAACQQGWPLFCLKVAVPLKDVGTLLIEAFPASEKVTVTRAKLDRLCAAMTATLLLVTVPLSFWLSAFFPLIAFSVSPIAPWLILRYNTPRDGYICLRRSPFAGLCLLFLVDGFLALPFLVIGLRGLGFAPWVIGLCVFLVLALALPIIVGILRRTKTRQRVDDDRRAVTACELWQRETTHGLTA